MLFSSVTFLFYFLPIVLILYFAVPRQMKNVVLLTASIVFYAWGEPRYVLWMLGMTVQGYVLGLWIEKGKHAKVWLTLSVILSLGLLCYLKYMDFFIQTLNSILPLHINTLQIALPVGVSFYTFQIVAYTIDVYRKKVPAEKNIICFATYVTMFCQLVAGPIVRYQDVAEELRKRNLSIEDVSRGCRKFVRGLSKKVLIANVLYEFVEVYKHTQQGSVIFAWMYALTYMLFIYFDFSGYSDMAIGLGEILGFHFPENFNYPYVSGSITEFWRRWHMTLGSWFRDYLYIPLGGNRVATWKWYRNVFIVWMATGLWHGAAWNFVIWGVYFAIVLVIEKAWLLKHLKNTKVWNHIYVLVVVMLSFVIFDADNLVALAKRLQELFGFAGLPFLNHATRYYIRSYGVMIICGIIGATPLPRTLLRKLKSYHAGKRFLSFVEPIWLFMLLAVCTAFLVDGSFNPFLYFRF